MAWEDDLARSIENLNRNVSRAFGGATTDSFLGARAANANTGFGGIGQAALKKTVDGVVGSLKVLHGSTDDLNHVLRRIIGFGVAGEVFDLIIESGRNLVRSYNKLSDVGQSFGGSLLSMVASAGAAGVSLEEFTRTLERNSSAAAVLQHSTSGSLGELQKEVRNNLKQFGFFGMTISQMNDATGDYMDTLIKSGNIWKMSDRQRQSSVQDIIFEATKFANAFGKSREELLKSAKEHMQDPDVLSRGAVNPEAQAAFNKTIVGMSAMSSTMAESFKKLFGYGPEGMWQHFEKIPLVNALQKLGQGDLVQRFADIEKMNERGQTVPPEVMIQFGQDLIKRFDTPQMQRYLTSMEGAMPEEVGTIRKMLSETRGQLNPENIKKLLDALHELQRPKSELEQRMLTFSDDFHNITGAFQKGFFDSFAKGVIGGNTALDKDGTPMWIKPMQESMTKLGTAFGEMLGKVFTKENIDAFTSGATTFMTIIGDTLPPILHGLVAGFTAIRDTIKKITGLGDGGADIMTVVGLYLLKRLVSVFSKMYFQRGIFYISNATGLGGGGAPGSRPGPTVVGGAPGAPGTPPPRTGVQGMLTRMFGQGGTFRSWGGTLIGMMTGIAATVAFDEIVKSLPDFPFKDKIMDFGGPAIGIIAGLLGPALLGSVATAVATWIGPALAAMMSPAVLVPAVVAALAVGGFLVAKNEGEKQANIGDVLGFVPSSMPGSVVDAGGVPMVSMWYDPKTKKTYTDDEAQKLLQERMKTAGAPKLLPGSPPQAAGAFPVGRKLEGAELAAANAALATKPVAPDSPPPEQPKQLSIADMDKKKAEDQAKIDSDRALLAAGKYTPDSQIDLLAEINNLMTELVNINKAQAALQKKTLDATEDINTYPQPML